MATPIGEIQRGAHRGANIQVEADESGTGYHLWVTKSNPDGTVTGWDIWADTWSDVTEWLIEEFDVRWNDGRQQIVPEDCIP